MGAVAAAQTDYGHSVIFELQLGGLTASEIRLNLDLVERGPLAVAAEMAGELRALVSCPPPHFEPGTVRSERLAPAILKGRQTRDLRLSVAMDRDRVVVESEDLGLFALGASYDEALDGLADQLDLVARQYLNTPDSKLTPSGLRLKARLREALGG